MRSPAETAAAANRWLMRRYGVRITREAPRDRAAWGVDDALRPPRAPYDRLLVAPVFVLSPMRSGSTLLRLLLDSHTQIHSPLETHLWELAVRPQSKAVTGAMRALGLDRHDLEHLLWDRVLHRQLQASGKTIIADKTPANVFAADRLAIAWPDARFVHLLRHPYSIVRSWHESAPRRRPIERATEEMLPYLEALERARTRHPGVTLRYEELTTDPEREMRRVCEFLGVPWEPALLDYGAFDHGPLVRGLGDWREKIRSGTVQPGRVLPGADEVPAPLRVITAAWGY